MKFLFGKTLTIAILLFTLWGCTEDIDTSARYVFTSDNVMSYLEKHNTYSEYVRLLKLTPISIRSKSTVGELLSARGHYTVFAPTNDAIQTYLEELCEEEPSLLSEPSWDAFVSDHKRDSVIRVVVCNSVIDSGDHEEAFQVNAFPQKTGSSPKYATKSTRTDISVARFPRTCTCTSTDISRMATTGRLATDSTALPSSPKQTNSGANKD